MSNVLMNMFAVSQCIQCMHIHLITIAKRERERESSRHHVIKCHSYHSSCPVLGVCNMKLRIPGAYLICKIDINPCNPKLPNGDFSLLMSPAAI